MSHIYILFPLVFYSVGESEIDDMCSVFTALQDAPLDMSGDSLNMFIKFSPNSAGAVPNVVMNSI